MTKDLHEDRDGGWSFPYPSFDEHIAIGEAKVWTQGSDVTVISYANGLWMSLRVAKRLADQGISCRVVDIRWLNPLPEDCIVEQANRTGKVLIVDECRKTGGVAESILSVLAERTTGLLLRRITGHDTYIPLGDAANRVLIQEGDIETAIKSMVERS